MGVRSWLARVGLVAVLVGGMAGAAENGLRVLAVPPATGGTTRLQVEVLEPGLDASLRPQASPDRFRVVVDAAGGRVTGVRRMADEAQDGYTILAFDQSGSFAAYWQQAFTLADAYAQAMRGRAHHSFAVMTFGVNKVLNCEAPSADALIACLPGVKKFGAAQKATRLKFYIQEAVREAARKLPLAKFGSREVIVFTDAGDESQALDVHAVASEARELGVRVHVVCFTRNSKGATLAPRLDEMQQLADGSGGHYLQVEDTKDPAQAVAELAWSLDKLYWLDVAFCGVKPGQTHDQISVEALTGGARTHWSDSVRFRQSVEGNAAQPCEAAPLAPTAAPEQPAAAPQASVPWKWLLLGLGGLIALLLLVLLLRRKPEPQAPVVAAAPPAPAPAPTPVAEPAPAPPAAPWRDPFVTLPETRLVVKRGPPGLESFYRVHKTPFTIGARANEMDLGVDVPAISGHHVTVQLYKNGNVFVTDERSTNGTFVDGRRLAAGERVQVKPGQTVRLATHLELLVWQPSLQAVAEPVSMPQPSAPAPAPPPAEAPRAKMKTVYAPAKGDDE